MTPSDAAPGRGSAAEGADAGAGPETGRLPGHYRRFLSLFEEGAYWESHEALEDAWRESGSGFYHGLILYASAFVHAARGNPHGIVAQLDKAREALEPYRPAYLGLDVAGLLEHAERCRRRVRDLRRDAGEGGPGAEACEAAAPAPRLEVDPARIRGDEPELRLGAAGESGPAARRDRDG